MVEVQHLCTWLLVLCAYNVGIFVFLMETSNEKTMRMFNPYRFKYLDADMVAVRTPNGVEILQEIQYEQDRDEIENRQ